MLLFDVFGLGLYLLFAGARTVGPLHVRDVSLLCLFPVKLRGDRRWWRAGNLAERFRHVHALPLLGPPTRRLLRAGAATEKKARPRLVEHDAGLPFVARGTLLSPNVFRAMASPGRPTHA
jgi:hypothetical protein